MLPDTRRGRRLLLVIGAAGLVLLQCPIALLSNLVSHWADMQWKLGSPLLLTLMAAMFQTWTGSVTARWLAVALLAGVFLAGGAATVLLAREAAHGPPVWTAALAEVARSPLFIVADALGALFAGSAAAYLAVSPSVRLFQAAQRQRPNQTLQ